MPSYTIKVPNDDEGEDLGSYEADYLPRVGDPFVLWHPRVCQDKDKPFCGTVTMVTHEAMDASHEYVRIGGSPNSVDTTVWLQEEQSAPTLYCDCTEEERARHEAVYGKCNNCGHVRS